MANDPHVSAYVRYLDNNQLYVWNGKTLCHATSTDMQIPTWCVVPGTSVVSMMLNLPSTMERHKAEKAIPYLLEEELTESIESIHYHVMTNKGNGHMPICYTRHEQMQKWTQAITPQEKSYLVPEYALVPYVENTWHVVLDEGKAHIRFDAFSGCTVDETLWEKTLLHAAGHLKKPNHVMIQSNVDKEIPTSLQACFDDIQVQRLDGIKNVYQPSQAQDFDLLKGIYARKVSKIKQANIIKLLFSALLLLLMATMVWKGFEYVRLQSKQKELNTQVDALYLKVYPDAQVIVSPKLRMQGELKQLRKQHKGWPFLSWLDKIGHAIKQDQNIEINRIQYRFDQLEIMLQTTSIQSLEALVNKLKQQGLSLKTQQVKSQQGTVSATIIITS